MAEVTVTTNSGKYLTFAQLESISKNSAEHAKTTNTCFWINTDIITDPIMPPRYDDVNTYWLDMTVEEFDALDSKDIYTESQYEKCECKEGETCHKGRSNLLNLDDYDVFYKVIVGGHLEGDQNVHLGMQETMAVG